MTSSNTRNPFILPLRSIDQNQVSLAGGKAANLGTLSRIEGIHVPDGFCISTAAFKKIIAESDELVPVLDQLALLTQKDRETIGTLSSRIRSIIEAIMIPRDIDQELVSALSAMGETDAYAVRSSATAEDLPTASFAGQQDTYLNITGLAAIRKHISKCWASLYTERAILYRIQNGFGHRGIYLAVVVQKMIPAQSSGILFTADPLTSNRKMLSIEAGFGLGEALVSGIANTDHYKVREGNIIEKKIAVKKRAVHSAKGGGIENRDVVPEQQVMQVLSDEQILELERLGRTIEAHFGFPQDIEWCWIAEACYIVQSRPVTTLYPIPQRSDSAYHVYVSVGHQQMMTDAIKPLGISFWQLSAARPMFTAGGRLFVDVADMLASPAARENILEVLGKYDPLIRDCLLKVIAQHDFTDIGPAVPAEDINKRSLPAVDYSAMVDDPAMVTDLIRKSQAAVEVLKQNMASLSGPELFDFIMDDLQHMRERMSDSQNLAAVMTGRNASFRINESMEEWLGEKNVADILAQSAPGNITSEMGLELLGVADVIRPYPEVIRYLKQLRDSDSLDGLAELDGGQDAQNAIQNYLECYGMRCVGEIDITRTRWAEQPAILVSMILSHIRNFKPGESRRKFERGLQDALEKERDLLSRLAYLPDAVQKINETKRLIRLIRNFTGYREYPKYHMINCYFLYRKALLKEAEQLVKSGIIREPEDVYYLSFEAFREAVRKQQLDYEIIRKAKHEYEQYEKQNPPRVMTSDGEIITGIYNRENMPAGAIAGLPVSAGVVEGRARVIINMENAELEEGDILVTSFTDPGWTALFVSIKGLITEVGGLMTHGAVIAREYGLPAIVGVAHATTLIGDRQRIRLNGNEGYVEIL